MLLDGEPTLWWPNLHVPTEAGGGGLGACSTGHFCYLYALKSILVHSETNIIGN